MRLLAINNPLGRTIHTIPITKLRNSYPGKIGVISEVKRSMKEHGMLNPLFVTPSEDGTYEVYVGINRFIAGKKLGFTEFDCYIAEPEDDLKEMDRFFKMKPVDFP